MRAVRAFILAGGEGSRLSVLAERRAKPAVPFGGMYRIIDFTLSNLMHSRILKVGICTQYRPFSLMDHIGNGDHWDMNGLYRGVRILPPYQGQNDTDWYRGTADAIYQNMNFVREDVEDVLIVSGDHIYRMDYTAMIRAHREQGADLTIATLEVPWEEASRFGVLVSDDTGQVREFQEKPAKPASNLASMGIYVFKASVLAAALDRAIPAGGYDFGKDVIPELVATHRVLTHTTSGYWRDVGTLASYWEAHMDLIRGSDGLDLARWRTRTNLNQHAPAYFGPHAHVSESLICRGATIHGEVRGSVISPGVVIARGARVIDSIVLHDGRIDESSQLVRCIVDKRCTIGAHCEIGGDGDRPNQAFPHLLNTGLTVLGKEAQIRNGATIGANTLIYPAATVPPRSQIPVGASVT